MTPTRATTTTDRPKPERLQEEPRVSPPGTKLKPDRVQPPARTIDNARPLARTRVLRALKRCPGWGLGADQRRLERAITFANLEQASIYVALAAKIAADRGSTPTVRLDGATVEILINTPGVAGITSADLALAAAMSLAA